jgi:hypothetical protein
LGAKTYSLSREREINNLKRSIGKIYSHSESICQVFVKLNAGAKNG